MRSSNFGRLARKIGPASRMTSPTTGASTPAMRKPSTVGPPTPVATWRTRWWPLRATQISVQPIDSASVSTKAAPVTVTGSSSHRFTS